MNKRFLALLALVAIIAVLPSCGSKVMKTDAVSGTVTYNGQPLQGAYVYFTPEGGAGNQAVAITDTQGVYKLQTAQGAAGAGTTPGTYTVTITHETVVEEGTAGTEESAGTDDKTKADIPAKYGDAKKSGLSATVEAGKENVFNFDLTD